MRRYVVIASVALAVLTAAASAASRHHSGRTPADPDFTFIRQAYAYMADAVRQKDVNKEYAYISDDYVRVSSSGRQESKSEAVAADYDIYRDFSANAVSMRETIQVLSLRHSGNNILAKVRIRLYAGKAVDDLLNGTGTMSGKIDLTRDDTWVPTADGWACNRSVDHAFHIQIHQPN